MSHPQTLPESSANDRRLATIERYAQDKEFLRKLRRKMAISLARSRVFRGRGMAEQFADLAPVAVAFGVFRLLYVRFAELAGNGPQWWAARRKERGLYPLNTIQDSSIAVECFGDALYHFFPEEGFSEEEILSAAAREYAFLSRGPNYGQLEERKAEYHRMWTEGELVRNHHSCLWQSSTEEPAVRDTTAQENLEDILRGRYTEDEQHILGVAVTYIFQKSCHKIGPRQALVWLLWKMYYEGERKKSRFGEILERLTGEPVDVRGAQAKELARKIAVMDEILLPWLREDIELQDLRDLFLDED